MKTQITAMLAVILAVVISMTICKALRKAERVNFDSDIVYPTHSAIADIEKTIAEGQRDLANRKLKLLDERLWDYRGGGSTPANFVSEITNLK